MNRFPEYSGLFEKNFPLLQNFYYENTEYPAQSAHSDHRLFLQLSADSSQDRFLYYHRLLLSNIRDDVCLHL